MERTGAGVRYESTTADNGTDIVGESQGSTVRTVNGAARVVRRPGQVELPAESSADVSVHGFWKGGTTEIVGI